jgi:hypothetical protein
MNNNDILVIKFIFFIQIDVSIDNTINSLKQIFSKNILLDFLLVVTSLIYMYIYLVFKVKNFD